VVLQAHQAGVGSLAAAEVSGPQKTEIPAEAAPSRKEEEARERIAPHVHGQVRQSEMAGPPAQKAPQGSARPTTARGHAHRQRRAEKSVRPTKNRLFGRSKTCEADEAPESDERKTGAQR